MDNSDKCSRRSFIGGIATAATGAVMPGVPGRNAATDSIPPRVGFFETVRRPTLRDRISGVSEDVYRASGFEA
jgi:hypothetical protein